METIGTGKSRRWREKYRVGGVALILLKNVAIWDGINQNCSFLGVTANTDDDPTTTFLKVSQEVEEGDSQGRAGFRWSK